MNKNITVMRLGFPELPAAKLPFYPRSCGINYFYGRRREEQPPGTVVELCWVANGECVFDFGETRCTVKADQAIYRLPGDCRAKLSAPDMKTVVYWATFDGPGAADFFLRYGYPRGALNSGKCPVHLFDEIRGLLNSLLPSDLRRLVALYTELIGLMGEEESGQQSRKGRLFRNALARIHSGYQNPEFDVNTLAELLGLHRTTLDRMFRRELGLPPNRYLTKMRLHHALSLLACTTLSIAEIAARTGFVRSNYFGRVFRENVGVTPLEYRRLRSREN